MNWNTSESVLFQYFSHSSSGFPCCFKYVFVNEIGAHNDSGHTQIVSPSSPSSTGAGTPHSMLPVRRNGTKVLPARNRMLLSFNSSFALSRSFKFINSIENEVLLSSKFRICSGICDLIAVYSSIKSFLM